MLVDFLKEMIKEKTYYKRIDDVIEIWQEKEKNTGKPYFVIKLLGSEIEIIEEDKKIEKLIEPIASEYTYDYAKKICHKINEIIDKLNEMEKNNV